MDPLSITASVAGIAAAGTALSKTLIGLHRTYRRAPQEMRSTAIELADLTAALEHLHEVIIDGEPFVRPGFVRAVERVVDNIDSTQKNISRMIEDRSVFARLKWIRAKRLLSDIGSHKITIILQTSILSTAILAKQGAGPNSPTHEAQRKRLRTQAESLVEVGQASLEKDSEENRHPDPPTSRAPTPPIRTTRGLPGLTPESNVPGHAASEDLFNHQPIGSQAGTQADLPTHREMGGQTSEANVDRLDSTLGTSQGEDDSMRTQVSGEFPDASDPVFGQASTRQSAPDNNRDIPLGIDQLSGAGGPRTSRNAASNRMTNFGRNFQVHGDAATLLYKLVFEDEEYESELDTDDDHLSDTSGTLGDNTDDDVPGNRARRSGRPKLRQPKWREPAQIVNRLLLDWTSLSDEEVASTRGINGNVQTRSEHRRPVTPDAVRNRPNQNVPLPPRAYVRRPGDEPRGGRTRLRPSQPTSPPPHGSNPFTPRSFNEHAWNGVNQQPTGPEPRTNYNTYANEHYAAQNNPWNSHSYTQAYANGFYPAQNNPRDPHGYARTYANGHYAAQNNPWDSHGHGHTYANGYYAAYNNPWDPHGYAPQGTYMAPFPTAAPPSPPSPPSPPAPSPPMEPTNQPQKSDVRTAAQGSIDPRPPKIVVLPQECGTNGELGATAPPLDVLCKGLRIHRQQGTPMWNSAAFTDSRGIEEKAIMACLIGDPTARQELGLDISSTLLHGQSLKITYIRGTDLGETWFLNEEAVFIQFIHCGYQPQFFSTADDDWEAKAREYLAIGEEWASPEALSQLGLETRGREDGRVLLAPTTTWVMVRELAIATLQLRSLRHRKKFTPTFYNSISTFRRIHGKSSNAHSAIASPAVASPIVSPIDDTRQNVAISPPQAREPELSDEVSNVFEYMIGNEEQSAPEAFGAGDSRDEMEEDAASEISSQPVVSRFFQRLRQNRKSSSKDRV